MALPELVRDAAWQEFMQRESALANALGLTKAELRAAVAAVDAWVDAASPSFNTALPAAARNALSASQKAGLLALILEFRYGIEL
jgi:NAD(P)H-dependent FMN reductase